MHQVLEEVRGQQGRIELFGEQGIGFAVDTGSSRQLAGVRRFQYVQRHAAGTVARDRFVTIPQRTRYLIPIHLISPVDSIVFMPPALCGAKHYIDAMPGRNTQTARGKHAGIILGPGLFTRRRKTRGAAESR
ncbi:hypothetical protein [Burkholderia gladioli]|uniref:hypothetical protein n=1 Tax=Burkholderia gladioli TaxID=28095 RepID=UPI00163E8B71|nr:hypothetical protein [Burkholderia gladioli]